ncbi:hypothetical protein RIF29_29715 [Crotalaria pallida]|uniref:Uncharacterized protein n=1 Tax=Crotalaria pallida TaxID=3830 RepID=A0AAN9EF20_CROPI
MTKPSINLLVCAGYDEIRCIHCNYVTRKLATMKLIKHPDVILYVVEDCRLTKKSGVLRYLIREEPFFFGHDKSKLLRLLTCCCSTGGCHV